MVSIETVNLSSQQQLVRESIHGICSEYDAAYWRVQTHGGFDIAREYDVERYFREARLTRLVPITQQLALNFIGGKFLDLARSY